MSGYQGGMAPTPAQLAKLRSESVTEEVDEEVSVYANTIITSSPLFITEVKHIIRSEFWKYQKRLLDLVDSFTENERMWAVRRRMMQDIQTEQLEITTQLVQYRILQEIEESNDRKAAKSS